MYKDIAIDVDEVIKYMAEITGCTQEEAAMFKKAELDYLVQSGVIVAFPKEATEEEIEETMRCQNEESGGNAINLDDMVNYISSGTGLEVTNVMNLVYVESIYELFTVSGETV